MLYTALNIKDKIMTSRNSNDNEKIAVYDFSIIQSNEHPKFKIGDMINNGYGNFIVKGFTRSFAGLAYVLDNGRKLIGWLAEQADKKCHLVENNSTKETLPKKIYLFENPITKTLYNRWLSKRSKVTDIEYARIDTIIEKSVKFFDEDIWKYIDVENANCDTFININGDKLKEDFKNYIKK